MASDYKETLNLPKTSFPMKANLAQKEMEILEFWQQLEIYAKMQQRDRDRSFILHDGPPYANGHIHLGHTLNKVLKDMIVKFKAMQGYYAPFVPGWDCHGLPIEHQVDKELGAKKDETPILEKRRLCREYAARFVDMQREEFRRLGVFGDWERPYITMDFPYESAIVREFNAFVLRDSVYRGKKPVHWCPVCVTALAEAEVEYADKQSPSIYVKFRVVNDQGKLQAFFNGPSYFVIWTTTPWTLPANMALALHPEYFYRLVTVKGQGLILAEELIDATMKKAGVGPEHFAVSGPRWRGADLEGIICRHPWIDREVRTIIGGHVTLEQGTGVVHTAPGHGEEDYEIGLKYGLPVFAPVDDRGRFTHEVEGLAGENVFRANDAVIEKLREVQALLGEPAVIAHSYPHCWRCKKPVLFRATEQWFISMETNELRTHALNEIGRVKWIPAWGQDRIHGMVQNRPDWCISRQRSWGVPITLLSCRKCGEFVKDRIVMGKIAQEVQLAGADVWFQKAAVEFLPAGKKCASCGSEEFEKETDILDVWFDSGVSHAAVMEADDRLRSPADLYLEGSDQHRGWFQSSLLASVGTRDRSPYRAVLTHGFVVDGQGKKMSKSLGNVISPDDITKRHGAEILRLWSASADYREDMRISDEIVSRLVEAYRKIRNTARFLLGNVHDFDPATSTSFHIESFPEIDRYALSILQGLIRRVTTAYETMAFHEVYHAVYRFCIIDMSAFYLDILKDRLYTYGSISAERKAAQFVLYNILISLTKIIAPILSFTAEEIWKYIPGTKEESVFLAAFPVPAPALEDKDLEATWKQLAHIRDEVNKALEIKRQEKFIGNGLEAKITIYADDNVIELLDNYENYLPILFIVSGVKTGQKQKEIAEGAFQSPEIPGMTVLVEKADGTKCQRCWIWDVSVGSFDDHPGLCKKCHEVLTT